VVRVIDRVGGRRYDVRKAEFDEVHGRRTGGVVIECDCGERIVLTGSFLESGEARPPEDDRRYSWLESYLPTLEGKQARDEYYARLD
jgi:hypothetical protein